MSFTRREAQKKKNIKEAKALRLKKLREKNMSFKKAAGRTRQK